MKFLWCLRCHSRTWAVINFLSKWEYIIDIHNLFTVTFQLLQQVLTRVLEEAGYTKDSMLALSDFVKVMQSTYYG